MTGWLRAGCVTLAVLAIGCFDSSVPLGPPERGEVDKGLVGTWRCTHPEDPTKTAKLWVIPFDRHQYYAEWRDGDDVSRYRAYSTRIGSTSLFNVEELTFRLSSAGWIFLRAVRGTGGGLTLSVVEKDSLKGLTGAAALQDIRRRVNDDSLYSEVAICKPE
jgi:hypothetical protein